MSRARPALFVAVLVFAGHGCARRVVLDPSVIPSRNDPAWIIQRAPKVQAPPPAAPTTVPPPTPPAAAPTPASNPPATTPVPDAPASSGRGVVYVARSAVPITG